MKCTFCQNEATIFIPTNKDIPHSPGYNLCNSCKKHRLDANGHLPLTVVEDNNRPTSVAPKEDNHD
jgi:hypothetical protein